MKMKLRKCLSTLLTCTVLSLMIFPSVANASTIIPEDSNTNIYQFSFDELSEQDQEFLEKMTLVFDGFTSDNSGKIIFTYSDQDLVNNFGFTSEEVDRLNEIVDAVSTSSVNFNDEYAVSPYIFYEGGIVYFTNDDVDAFLFAAASVGPEAVYAALMALGTVSLGPVGTALTIAVGALGFPSLAQFCYYVIQAATMNQGVYIGVEMNGVFPNIISGTW